MAGLLLKTEKFAVFDEKVYFKNVYKTISLEYDPVLFKINNPFMPDSQFEALKTTDRRIRKRKTTTLIKDSIFIEACEYVKTIHKSILTEGQEFFQKVEKVDNNLEARAKAKMINTYFPLSPSIVCDDRVIMNSDLLMVNGSFGSFITNSDDQAIRIFVGSETDITECILPQKSSFCSGDITNFNRYKEIKDEPFNLLIMDPPWYNKSVKRTVNYKLNESWFTSLSVTSLSKNGLCCIWITNRSGILDDLDSILSEWGLSRFAIWYWLKVTVEGEPVCEFASDHKVPFERIVFACYPNSLDHWVQKIPKEFVCCSVPMSIHSHKPPLPMLLSAFNIESKGACELFARNLLPHTVSIGYEPLLLQRKNAFVAVAPS